MMASTSIAKDYVHVVENVLADKVSRIKTSSKSVNGYAFNYTIWKTQIYDRMKTYPVIDKY